MPAPTTTLAAIHAQWLADVGISAAGWTLWNDEPPEGTTLDSYFVVEGLRETEKLDAAGAFKWLDARWTFAGFQIGDASAEAAALTVRAAFNDKTLPVVVGRNFFQMTQVGYSVKLDQTRSTTTQRVLAVRLDFQAEWSLPGAG